MKAKSGRRLAMVLCTDVLVLIEERNLYRMVSVSLPQSATRLSFKHPFYLFLPRSISYFLVPFQQCTPTTPESSLVLVYSNMC